MDEYVGTLKIFNITTISALDESIRKNKKEIVCFPWNWIKGTLPSEDGKARPLEIKADVEMELFTQKDGFMRGITIFYLGTVLAAENPDNLKVI